MKEDSYIVCGEYDLHAMHCDGSVMTHCCKCDAPLWLSPSGLELVAEHNAKPVCLECLKKIDKNNTGGTRDFAELNPNQLSEILKHMTMDDLNRLQERLRKEFEK